jgi:hypothetical protein
MNEKIEKFIRENELNFNSSGSSLNGAYTIVCGYADHVGASKKAVKEGVQACIGTALSTESKKELDKIYKFTTTFNYGKWWQKPEASRMYKF